MTDPAQSPSIALQQNLCNFLNAEFLHTLGSYALACDRFGHLRSTLGKSAVERALDEAAEGEFVCNDHLRRNLHRAAQGGEERRAGARRPSPFGGRPPEKQPDLPDAELLEEIGAFYVDAEAALSLYSDGDDGDRDETAELGARLGRCLAFVHDPQRRGSADGSQETELTQGKINRTGSRLDEVCAFLPDGSQERLRELGRVDRKKRFLRTLAQHAGNPEGGLAGTIIRAMSEAHMWMHEAEHIRGKSFGPMLAEIPDTYVESQRMLRYSHVLNTFVFVAARALPWIFAEDEQERDLVIDDFDTWCKRLAPTYCMWISAQFSLLALSRRAFALWTAGKRDEAYRDFHKLTRLLRGLRKPAEKRGLRVPGTKTFIAGMTGMSELHIGRIYRGQHAHAMALDYFKRASNHLTGWEGDPEIGPIIRNSHWRINLLLNEGKANYELGRIKRSLLAYAEAWRAFLLLVESETHATANLEVVTTFIKWLAPLVEEPTLSRTELRDSLEPLIEQFVTLRSPAHLRLMAADLVMRLGHLLFILQLPGENKREPDRWEPKSDHEQALRCIEHATTLDSTSTLTAADLLKIKHARGDEIDMDVVLNRLDETPLAEHWPSGSGPFEEVARVTEYVLQRWLAIASAEGTEPGALPGDDAEEARTRKLARELIGSFLAHTDSSNVKLAQVYRYLMEEERQLRGKQSPEEYTLDFVSMRRYSSFFPFLPRPTAFRAAGGGYFVRVREPGKDRAFGIAIDPGPDFIENLYRCGYALADIHMIILTHDHADHIASVDALLSLMGIRRWLGDDTFNRKGKQLAIVGNKSVYKRYSFFNKDHPKHRDPKTGERDRADAVKVLRFDQMAEIGWDEDGEPNAQLEDAEIYFPLEALRIEPVKTWGHEDAHGHIAQGFMLSFGPGKSRSSILFTGDTGIRPKPGEPGFEASEELLAGGDKTLKEAVQEADVVVAHLSSVPLRELRELAGMQVADPDSDEVVAEFRELWEEAARQANREEKDEEERRGVKRAQFLIRQVQFGFRSSPPRKAGQNYEVSPLSDTAGLRQQSPKHLYLSGLLEVAKLMAEGDPSRSPLLLVGELREELGTFRTQIAHRVSEAFFKEGGRKKRPAALTTDIGLRVRISRPEIQQQTEPITVLCTTCDLDNDLMPAERFHAPDQIYEVCVKGEDEGVFYNCPHHNPRRGDDDLWLESVERYDVFGG